MSHSKRYPCRCINCEARRSLNMKPDDYMRAPKCNNCGGARWRLDRYRLSNEMGGVNTCNCGGYHFPHRAKSRFCFHHVNAETIWSDFYAGKYVG